MKLTVNLDKMAITANMQLENEHNFILKQLCFQFFYAPYCKVAELLCYSYNFNIRGWGGCGVAPRCPVSTMDTAKQTESKSFCFRNYRNYSVYFVSFS